MTNEKLYEMIGDISDRHIKEAKQISKAKQVLWIKWSFVAACLCFVVSLAIPVLTRKGDIWQKDPSKAYDLVQYNGAYYEVVKDKDILDKFNLPDIITEDMVGDSLGKTKDPNGKTTERIMYQYTPYMDIVTVTTELEQERHQSAVYIIQDGDGYSFALFCNFLSFDSNTHTEASEMFAVYGIDDAEDIASIVIDGKRISNPAEIITIFEAIYSSCAMGNDDYQNAIFKGKGEEEQQLLAKELADSTLEIKIVTEEGLVINHISYNPTINYISWALNYYKLDVPIGSEINFIGQ